MAMADVLAHCKEVALSSPDPHLLTVATLTGHCVLAYGESYSCAMDNGPAARDGFAHRWVLEIYRIYKGLIIILKNRLVKQRNSSVRAILVVVFFFAFFVFYWNYFPTYREVCSSFSA